MKPPRVAVTSTTSPTNRGRGRGAPPTSSRTALRCPRRPSSPRPSESLPCPRHESPFVQAARDSCSSARVKARSGREGAYSSHQTCAKRFGRCWPSSVDQLHPALGLRFEKFKGVLAGSRSTLRGRPREPVEEIWRTRAAQAAVRDEQVFREPRGRRSSRTRAPRPRSGA